MKKVLTVARAEYLIAVTSKAFLLGVAMMPLFMGGAIVVRYLTEDQVDLTPRKIAIVDRTGKLFPTIASAADTHNEHEIYKLDDGDKIQIEAEFIVEAFQPETLLEETGKVDGEAPEKRIDAELSGLVEKGDLFAFAIIEPGVFDSESGDVVRYHSQTPSYMALANWLRRTVNAEIKRERTERLGLSEADVASLSAHTPVRTFGLVKREKSGKVKDAEERSELATFGIPFGGLMLMFMMVMSVAPTMLNNVLEEKMQKISEFLVSSISPFQLMLGKLLGAVAVGLTLSSIYLGAAFGLTHYFEVADRVPIELYAWFVFFLLVALVIFGSIFSAIGAACSEIRDAQSLMTPVMLLVIIPMMCIGPILDSPSSTFSRVISLFPPATPMLMFARIAIPPGPAFWEIALAAVLTVLFAAMCVAAAGRIFRIGILSQGQAPSMAKLIGWIFTK